ncbi:CLUMA_CG012695, isoform B [Clunio marinus]|uniref:CLUMA_CG012695, isoform B n=1 Tax=Clunio marinus TaxID=568069 RepID=A0A1J1ILK8_9DIPT|nr:CLUMA_CG012695, isoform B [Clunio marinus]
MFSGITNQVSSLTSMFSKNADEDVPTPPQSATAAAPSEEVTQQTTSEPPADNNNTENQSPTKASGGMFSNVTGKVSGWLPSSLPTVSMPTVSMPHMPSIPGLRKSQPTEDSATAEGTTEQAVEAQPTSNNEKDDDDRSSATGGADSRPVSEKGSPTEEQAGMVGNVTHKVTAGAKSFGSFFTGVVNKAGAKIKETVKDNSILGEFNKEQEAFIKDQSGKSDEVGICPWIGHQNEDKIKEEILSLSADRRNFVRAPPAGIEYEFSYDASYPTALALMAEDSQLEKMRFDLVPKIITEENFWRNYFYRVSLIIQAGDLGTLGTDDAFGKRDDDDVSNKQNKKCNDIRKLQRKSESEFISDKFKTANEHHTVEVQENMTRLGMTVSSEKQLQTDQFKKSSPEDIKRKKINEENENSLIISKKEGKMRSEA